MLGWLFADGSPLQCLHLLVLALRCFLSFGLSSQKHACLSNVYHKETITWLLVMEKTVKVPDESTLCSVLGTISVLSHVQESVAAAGVVVTCSTPGQDALRPSTTPLLSPLITEGI